MSPPFCVSERMGVPQRRCPRRLDVTPSQTVNLRGVVSQGSGVACTDGQFRGRCSTQRRQDWIEAASLGGCHQHKQTSSNYQDTGRRRPIVKRYSYHTIATALVLSAAVVVSTAKLMPSGSLLSLVTKSPTRSPHGIIAE